MSNKEDSGLMDYREEDRPMLIKLPEGFDTSHLFKFSPGKCADCDYRAIGACSNGKGQSASYCGVHRDEIMTRTIGWSE